MIATRIAGRLCRRPRAVALGACLLSAAILTTAQVVREAGWLIFLGLVPACLVLNTSRFFRTWGLLALINGLYTPLTLAWLYTAGGGFAWTPLVAAAYTAIGSAIPAACCRVVYSRRLPAASLLVLPAGWALHELLARVSLLHASWAILGLPLAEWPALAQVAAIAGPEGLSYLVVATNVGIALAVGGHPRSIRCLGILQGPGLLIVALAWGVVHLGAARESGGPVRVAVIQPDIEQGRKWDPEERASALARIDRLIDRVLPEDPKLIVLPETAVPGFVRFEDDLTDWVRGTVIRTRLPLLFGSLDLADDPSRAFNVAMMITPYNTVTTYRKIRLVPIAECVSSLGPLKDLFIFFRGSPDEFTAGGEFTLFEQEGGPAFATMICYEDIFPDLARGFATAGAEFLIVLINTGQFKGTCQGWQHLRRARLTAISVGLPMIRCANSGISCLIDPNGRILDEIPGEDGGGRSAEGAQVFALPLGWVETPSRRFGDSLMLGALVSIVGLTLCLRFFSMSPLGSVRR